VPVMGGHAWDPDKQPDTAANWTEPVMVMGTYGGKNIYYEPMPPLSFVTGDTDTFWEESIIYENQQTENLASYASVSYDASTGVATATFKGKSSISKEEFENLKNGDDSGDGGFFGWVFDLFAAIFEFLFGWIA